MNSFTVVSAVYDGTSGDLNPLCGISGTVNGLRVFPQVFFAYLAVAEAAGQMQAALTAVLFNWYAGVYGFQFTPWPTPIPFPASNAAAVHTQGPYPQPYVIYAPALTGS